MAEDAVAARIASQLGSAGAFPPALAAAATAKSVAGKAAARIAASAHAVHGAIGISEEHDLQLFTRRLHAWRLAEACGFRVLGRLPGACLHTRKKTWVDGVLVLCTAQDVSVTIRQ